MSALHQAPPTEEPQETGGLSVADLRIDPDTGEILGQKFAVTDQSSAEWLMEKLLSADVEILALEARKAALVRNMDDQIKSAKSGKAKLEYRYGPELHKFAESTFKGTKTWQCPYGKVSAKIEPEKWKLKDGADGGLLNWAKQNLPKAVNTVQTSTVWLNEVSNEVRKTLPQYFDHIKEDEKFTIKTEVGK